MNEAMSVELCSVSDGISVTKELTVETLWTLTEVAELSIKAVSGPKNVDEDTQN